MYVVKVCNNQREPDSVTGSSKYFQSTSLAQAGYAITRGEHCSKFQALQLHSSMWLNKHLLTVQPYTILILGGYSAQLKRCKNDTGPCAKRSPS